MHTYNKISIALLGTLMLLLSGFTQASTPSDKQDSPNQVVKEASSDFPGRKKYPHVPYISIEQLQSEYENTVIVDARSPFEYETLRIKSAVNIPLSLTNSDYTTKLQKLRNANPDKKIVFYCNGHTCMKSYKATNRAKVIAKIGDVFAFDAGIFTWTKAHPDKAALLGETPVDTSKLISKSKLKEHMLSPDDFVSKADENAIILDVRSRNQRNAYYVFSRIEESFSMGNKHKLKKFINQAIVENKTLFIYDAVGKQVRWLQYFLESQNAGPYYFMKGGSEAFFDTPEYKISAR